MKTVKYRITISYPSGMKPIEEDSRIVTKAVVERMINDGCMVHVDRLEIKSTPVIFKSLRVWDKSKTKLEQKDQTYRDLGVPDNPER